MRKAGLPVILYHYHRLKIFASSNNKIWPSDKLMVVTVDYVLSST
jgi:hypothetical protein